MHIYATVYSWIPDYGFEGLVNAISLAVLLGTNTNELERLKTLLNEHNIKDCIIDNMMYYLDPKWEVSTIEVKFPKVYEILGEIVTCNNLDKRKELLKQYLDEWYSRNDFTAWHDSHKSKQASYNGYWSFEAGAIAKVLKIDDRDLKEQQYYPYDLVHFDECSKDEKLQNSNHDLKR